MRSLLQPLKHWNFKTLALKFEELNFILLVILSALLMLEFLWRDMSTFFKYLFLLYLFFFLFTLKFGWSISVLHLAPVGNFFRIAIFFKPL